ncbi:thiamine pyrophosphate-dependent dehydrogenase E1 component subunit alpha [Tetragenococcus halophilus]|uniref:thiamine pyrophosphate-dependent dehydrogenase E1 component subunit alpha n=1 Tax=Tetragenococcus halophilus TaxID=51669 RepID=UPI001F2A4C85|nr:thiamine pyrophosphate-dependent dehydrogenase E1 component subunit alpha [Tetragenococcus halophilus]MCF1684951.1 thiamine pyrophosphate-dependent dehydrogenase E1 component subunit alpha [Tetragenococcus halophilus]
MKKINKERAKWILQKMEDIRHFEAAAKKLFAGGDIPGFVHLYAGEEAIATGVCAHLSEDDSITSTHRGHGHCIAKGCDLKGMMAEVLGRKDGLCKGKGGSMHIADIDKGMLGANGIVGGGITLATGAGLRNKYLKTKDVAVCFFGDGASNEGSFHEGLNLASIWKLPVVFVNENNMYGEGTPHKYASSTETISERAVAYDIPGETIDGKNVVAVYEAAGKAIDRARKGDGPTLIECLTYRDHGHFEGDEQKYKAPEGKEKELADRNSVEEFKEYALKEKLLSKKDIEKIDKQSEEDVQEAIDFAENSPIPEPESLYEDVFAE